MRTHGVVVLVGKDNKRLVVAGSRAHYNFSFAVARHDGDLLVIARAIRAVEALTPIGALSADLFAAAMWEEWQSAPPKEEKEVSRNDARASVRVAAASTAARHGCRSGRKTRVLLANAALSWSEGWAGQDATEEGKKNV